MEWLLLGVALLLVAANAIFVAAEFALVTVDRSTVEREADGGDRRAQGVRTGLRSLSTQLSGAQLGITVSSLAVGFLAEPSLAQLLRTPLGAVGLSDGAVSAVAVLLAVVVATGFQAVFGELVPKNWAIAQPLRVGRVVVGAQRMFTATTRPLILVLNGSANALLRAVNITPQEELASARSPRELASLAARSGSEGTLEQGTAELVERATEFSERTAADVMTPRARTRMISATDTVATLIGLTASSGHARFPVIADTVDEVLGAVHFTRALGVPEDERDTRPVRELVSVVPLVPETMPLDGLLRVLRESPLQLAVVLDEYGGTAGVVTLEDLVEEIVGEISDEQDEEPQRGHREPDGSWSLSGMLRPDEAGELTDLTLPEARESDTLAGLVAEHLERLPEVDDVVVLDARDTGDLDSDGLPVGVRVELRVTHLDGRRLDRVRLTRLPTEVPA